MKLDVWSKAVELSKVVWQIVYRNHHIDFKLRSQITDAAQSVSANIAEGYGRRSINEYIQFLYFALGSLAETLTRAIGLKEMKQISENEFREIDALHYEVENKLLKLVESLQRKREAGTWLNRISDNLTSYT